MRPIRLALAVPALAALAFAGLRLATGDEPPPGAMPAQKPIKQAFMDCLLGSWTTEHTANFGMGPTKGTGKATFGFGAGGSALIEEYQNKGGMGEFFGHGVFKVADDNKGLTCWWFHSWGAEPYKYTGTLTDTSLDMSTTGPHGTMRIKMEKTPTGLAFHMLDGSGTEQMTETYKPAPK
jgi:hypothetical protein